MSETKKETIWGDEPVEQAVLDYDKLQFYRVFPPSLPGDTAADCMQRAFVHLTGYSYFKNDETGEYDLISSDVNYQCFGTIPAIDGGFVIPYIDSKYIKRLGMLDFKRVFAEMRKREKRLYELVKYDVPKCWQEDETESK
jgi:hypothetical protein